MNRRMLIGTILAVAVAAPAAAQSDGELQAKKLAAELEMQTMTTMRGQGVVESRITEGRPYVAEATTEFVQVLGDGNRISRKTTVRIYRDGEGRTRREELGSGDVVQSISIYDPVTHASYVLDPTTRTAHKSAIRIVYPQRFQSYGGEEYAIAVKERAEVEALAGKISLVAPTAMAQEVSPEAIDKRKAEELTNAEVGVRTGRGRGTVPAGVRARNPFEKSTTESLGQQAIGGVTADGTRTTTVIAAGVIGNQQEIRIVSEQWFSTDLQVLVMTRHSDPRSGETTYRLSNIIRAEPGSGLFDVPPDYTIKESSYMKAPALR